MTFTAATMTRICLVSYCDYMKETVSCGVTAGNHCVGVLYLQWRGSSANRFPFEAPYSEQRRGAGSTM